MKKIIYPRLVLSSLSGSGAVGISNSGSGAVGITGEGGNGSIQGLLALLLGDKLNTLMPNDGDTKSELTPESN